jgi:ferredoxin-NADP reductase
MGHAPQRDKKLISITVKATPEGFLSDHLVNGVEPGTVVRLAAPKGDFALPDPPPPKLLFVTAGSGITPVMAMLRTLQKRGQQPDVVHIHSARSADEVIFHDELRDLEGSQPGYRLHLQLTAEMGKFDFAGLDGATSLLEAQPAGRRQAPLGDAGFIGLRDGVIAGHEAGSARGQVRVVDYSCQPALTAPSWDQCALRGTDARRSTVRRVPHDVGTQHVRFAEN